LEEGPIRKEESKMQAQNPGKIIDATATTFQEMVLSSSTPVAVDFWAPW
jgi:thioredoxin-like negative regulator of GroEL